MPESIVDLLAMIHHDLGGSLLGYPSTAGTPFTVNPCEIAIIARLVTDEMIFRMVG